MTLVCLLLSGALGLFCHWLKKWGRGQTAASFPVYMQKHKKHSVASISTLIGAVVGMFTLGDIALTSQSLATAFLAGFAIDSTLNKSPEDRK